MLTERANELSHGPPNRQQSKQSLRSLRKEFEKECLGIVSLLRLKGIICRSYPINWEISTNSYAKCCIESANTNPRVTSTHGKTKDSGDEEGRIECETPAQNVRSNAPEGSANT